MSAAPNNWRIGGCAGCCRGRFDCFCCPHTSVHRPSIACLAVFLCGPGALFLHALSGPSTICPFPPHSWSAPDGLPLLLRKQPIWALGDTPHLMPDAPPPPPPAESCGTPPWPATRCQPRWPCWCCGGSRLSSSAAQTPEPPGATHASKWHVAPDTAALYGLPGSSNALTCWSIPRQASPHLVREGVGGPSNPGRGGGFGWTPPPPPKKSSLDGWLLHSCRLGGPHVGKMAT